MSSSQDVRFNEERVKQGRDLANKMWNASRLILLNARDDVEPGHRFFIAAAKSGALGRLLPLYVADRYEGFEVKTFGELTDAGLVTRTVAEGPPVSVIYTLTEAGRALLPALEQVRRWAERHLTTRGGGNSATPESALRQARRR
jgi:hypothetical protein